MAAAKHQGWAWIGGATKAHYFADDGRALCGRWLFLGNPEALDNNNNNHTSPDNCTACQRKFKAVYGEAAYVAKKSA